MNKTEKFELLLSTAYQEFPDIKNSGTITRAQIQHAVQVVIDTTGTKLPEYILMQNTVSRGVYALPTNNKPTLHKTPVAVSIQDSLIPATDLTYVPFGIHKDVEKIIKSEMFYPSYIYGPTGNGKSTTVEQICSKLGRSLIRINLNAMTDEEQLIGTKTLVDGNIEVVEGPIIRAMKSGDIILLDEIDAANANSILALQSIIEGKPYYFKLTGEMIVPVKGFNIFATANTKGKGSEDGRYIGTNILNEAFLERFAVTFVQDYPGQTVELKIITNVMEQYECIDTEFAADLVKWANTIRKTFDDGGIDENITTRRLIHIVRAFAIFKDRVKAIELATNRFDESTRLAFLDLFDKIKNDDIIDDIDTLFTVNDEV